MRSGEVAVLFTAAGPEKAVTEAIMARAVVAQ